MVVEHIPTKELDEPNGLRSGASLWTRHGWTLPCLADWAIW
jgi:hypothetical protein